MKKKSTVPVLVPEDWDPVLFTEVMRVTGIPRRELGATGLKSILDSYVLRYPEFGSHRCVIHGTSGLSISSNEFCIARLLGNLIIQGICVPDGFYRDIRVLWFALEHDSRHGAREKLDSASSWYKETAEREYQACLYADRLAILQSVSKAMLH